MPLPYYTTQIAPNRTTAEIQEMLANAGAQAVSIQYDAAHQPDALAFEIRIRDRTVAFRLPSRWKGVSKLLGEDPKVPAAFRGTDQAHRVAWRILRSWVQAQLAIIEAEMVTLPEVFLPYAVGPSGKTVWEQLADGNMKLLE